MGMPGDAASSQILLERRSSAEDILSHSQIVSPALAETAVPPCPGAAAPSPSAAAPTQGEAGLPARSRESAPRCATTPPKRTMSPPAQALRSTASTDLISPPGPRPAGTAQRPRPRTGNAVLKQVRGSSASPKVAQPGSSAVRRPATASIHYDARLARERQQHTAALRSSSSAQRFDSLSSASLRPSDLPFQMRADWPFRFTTRPEPLHYEPPCEKLDEEAQASSTLAPAALWRGDGQLQRALRLGPRQTPSPSASASVPALLQPRPSCRRLATVPAHRQYHDHRHFPVFVHSHGSRPQSAGRLQGLGASVQLQPAGSKSNVPQQPLDGPKGEASFVLALCLICACGSP